MTTVRRIEIGAMALALVLGALFLRGWIAERGARNDADAFAKAQNAQVDVLKQQISASKDVDAAYRAGKADTARSIATPQQAVKIIAQYLPAQPAPAGAPAPAVEAIPVVSANELDAEVRAKLPAAPEYAILTPTQTEAIAKNDLACDADRHSLAACTVQLADTTQIAALNDAKAKKYDQAMKGGSILQRVGKVLKYAACAGGGAAIAAVGTRGTQSQYPATVAGAAGGVVLCSMF